jgi:hypothetical protein
LSWPRPNFVDPVTRPNTMLIAACVCGPITIGLLLARLWVRIFHQRNPGWDDWLMLAATVSQNVKPILLVANASRYLPLL